MILIPAVSIPLVMCFSDDSIPTGMSKNDRDLMKLILVIASAVPSGDTTIALCLQYGRFEASSALSQAYLFQYLVATVTLTAVVAIGHGWVY